MKLLGILRASALFILVSAFHGQPVSCGLFKSNKKSKKDSNAKVSENLKDSTVKSQVAESSENPGESGVRSSGSENTSQVSGPSAYERELDEQLRIMAERRKEAVERLSKSDAPFSLEDMTLFLGILKKGADVDPEAVQKIGEKMHAYLGSLGIHGEDAKGSLENLMEKIIKHNTYVSDMFYGPIQQHYDEASEASEVGAKSDVNPQQDGSVVNEDEIPMKSEKF